MKSCFGGRFGRRRQQLQKLVQRVLVVTVRRRVRDLRSRVTINQAVDTIRGVLRFIEALEETPSLLANLALIRLHHTITGLGGIPAQ